MQLALVLALALAPSTPQQRVRAHPGRIEPETVASPVVFVGRVVTSNARPARGAVVTTSAGGRGVTGANGRFELAVDVPVEAESVVVTALADAAGGASLTASLRVVPASLSPVASLGTFVLVNSVPCRERWVPTFGGLPGLNGSVHALVVHDDGSGPELYAGGDFTVAGDAAASCIAKWNGTRWKALGSGMAGGDSTIVHALAVFDDGSGPELYAGGVFDTAGGVVVNHVARWDGAQWSALAGGVGGQLPFGNQPCVRALAVFDNGSGPALYAGGDFSQAGGAPRIRLARWNGASWGATGGQMNAPVHALAVVDDGSGPALYAGGEFTTAGGIAANRIVKWDGSTWTALGSGVAGGSEPIVHALTGFDDGGGVALYAGGTFTSAGGGGANRIARWDGSSWSALASGVGGTFSTGVPTVRALAVFDDVLYVAGRFETAGAGNANHIAGWDGSDWSALASGLEDEGNHPFIGALASFDDGGGQALHAAGSFVKAGGLGAIGIAAWDGASWNRLGTGLDDTVHALLTRDDGSGPALYAAGEFSTAGGLEASSIVEWDGSSWATLGSGMGGTHRRVYALAEFDDGGGPALYAGGTFTTAGGVPANRIAKWDGSSWTALGSGVSGTVVSDPPTVRCLAVFDDGTGDALYVGGNFRKAGGLESEGIARWDGSSWSQVSEFNFMDAVYALTVFDDGNGPALYAGGSFQAFGSWAVNVARWNGASWDALQDGVGEIGGDAVFALAGFDDGTGPALFAGGRFFPAGGEPVSNVARWNGTSWSALGGSANTWVFALTTFDGGLYAGGYFTTIGGVAMNRIARWDGQTWSPLSSGHPAGVFALTTFDAGDGPALIAGGAFAGPGDGHLAKWACVGGRARQQDL